MQWYRNQLHLDQRFGSRHRTPDKTKVEHGDLEMSGRVASPAREQFQCEVGESVAGYLVPGGLVEVARDWLKMQVRGTERQV